jgi:gamma-glutamylcyclotransferase (GGCT)/AIG2-like uncharacterized protein YtfP
MPLTFAYGSNMDFTQMRERCPSAVFVCIAVLKDHRLGFTRKSISRGCGVADVVPANGKSVWGVVYNITEADREVLDAKEGYKPTRTENQNAYNRRSVPVNPNGEETPTLVEIYFAVPQANPPLPNQTYKDLIVNGAKHWNLPADYIAELEAIEIS